MSFIRTMKEQAKKDNKTIVLPESGDARVIEAASVVLREGLASVVLIGDEAEIRRQHPAHDLTGAAFVDPRTAPYFDDFVDAFYELRKHKGMTPDKARVAMSDPTTFGIMMLKQNKADGLVAGAVNSTADTLRPALQILRTKPGTKLVSAFFIMVTHDPAFGDDGLFLFADCGLNEHPDAEQLAEIALASADSFERMTGGDARVAMLSYSTLGSADSELTRKVVEATRLAKEKAPDRLIDGELQLDAAIVPKVALLKAPESKVAGRANCLIFPDLNAGNIGYKLVQRLAGAEAYGPILQGIAKPVNDLSRGCSVDDIVGVVALTCVQAQADA